MNYLHDIKTIKKQINKKRKPWDYIYYGNLITKSNTEKNWEDPYVKYEKIEEIPKKNRLIETQYTNELNWLFERLNFILNENFFENRKSFFNSVIGQYAQDYLEENGEPETAEPLLNAVISGAKDWFEYLVKSESLEKVITEKFMKKNRGLIDLKKQITNGKYGRYYMGWGGADVIVTDTHTEWADENIYVISFQEIRPRRREVLTKHYLEVSWLFIKLRNLFVDTYDYGSKYDFYAILAQQAINYIEKNGDPETPEPLLLEVLNGARLWNENLKQGYIRRIHQN